MFSEWAWKKINFYLGFLAIGVLFGLVVFASNLEIKDLDLWLHLKMGEWIVQHHYVPDHDVLSCTIAGKPWINHEWLFQVLIHYIYSFFDFDGLITMQVVVVCVTFVILLLMGFHRDHLLGVVFLLLIVLLVYQFRFTIRPDIFSLLFFILFIYTLSLHLDKPWSVLALLAIQVLWSNFHGFFFLGPLIVFIGLFSEYTKRCLPLPWEWNQTGRLTDEEFRRLKWIFLIVLLACLLNPQTFKGAWYPVSVAFSLPSESKIFFDAIVELQKPVQWNTIFSPEYSYYKLMIFLSFISFIFNRRRLDLGSLILWLAFLFFSLVAVRNLVFFAFVAYLVCLTNFMGIPISEILPIQFSERKFLYMTSIALQTFLIIWMLDYCGRLSERGYYDFDQYERKSEYRGVSQRSFPNKAADFLVAHQIKGNFLNDFNSGAYLVGRTSPQIKVFIDGRTELYGAEFFKKYRDMWKDQNIELLEQAINRYQITGALLNTIQKEVPEKVLLYFGEHKEWVPVYFDYDGLVFLKDIPFNQKWIKELRLDLATYRPPRVDLHRLGSVVVTPFREINRGYTYEVLGFDHLAIEEALHARKMSPGYIEPYKILGKVYGKNNDHEKAFENFRIAAMINPDDLESRYNLALVYERLGEYKYAIKQYERLLNSHPGEAKAYYLLAKIYALDRQTARSLQTLKQAAKRDPAAVVDILKIGDIYYGQGELESALSAFLLALRGKREATQTHLRLGKVYRALGEEDKATEEFRKGLAIEPNNPQIERLLNNPKALEEGLSVGNDERSNEPYQ